MLYYSSKTFSAFIGILKDDDLKRTFHSPALANGRGRGYGGYRAVYRLPSCVPRDVLELLYNGNLVLKKNKNKGKKRKKKMTCAI